MALSEHDMERLARVKASYEGLLMDKANVVGVGIGFRRRSGEPTDEPVIVVLVTHKVPRHQLEPEDILPRELEGVPLDVQAVGELRVLDAASD